MNTVSLKSSKFIKLLKDAGLIRHGVLQDHSLVSQTKQQKRSKWQTQAQALTTVQADLIFTKLTGNEKPSGIKLLLPSPRPLPADRHSKFTLSLTIDTFARALVLVGRTAYNLIDCPETPDIEVLFRVIDEFLLQLDADIQSSERGINHNAQLQIQ
jgi:hypothetical protein